MMRSRPHTTSLEPRRLLAFTPYNGDLLEQVVFSGLTQPVAVEFAPDGRVFVSEKAGVIKTYSSLSDENASVVLDIRDQVNGSADRGLLGLALSPNYANDHHVYLLYTFDGDLADSTARGTYTDQSDATVSGKLVRYTFDGNGLVNPVELIHDWPNQFSSHSIGHLQFGSDGYLYASAGDGASFNNVDYGQSSNPFGDPTNEGGALRSQDIRTDGDALGLDGTIIRIDPSTGAGAPGNPFASAGDANKRRIIAFGLRNPYRFNFRPGTAELWIGDVGWNRFEEINRLQSFGTNYAPNFQWPAFEGTGQQASYRAANLPLLSGLYDGSVPSVSPYYAYDHSAKIDVTGEASEPVGGSSITGVAFYTANVYPYTFDNALFVADYARQTIYTMRAGSNGLPDVSTARLMRTGVKAVELQTGPGGDIFFVDIGSGKVVRLTSKGPTARLTASATTGDAPLSVNFSAADSTDPDEGDALTYAWDLDDDGSFDDATGAYASRTFSTSGTYTVRVRATDYASLTDTAEVTIRVGSTVPVPTITTPTTDLHWRVGQSINFSGTATDVEDGTLPASALRWQVVLRHANEDNPNTAAHDHIIATYDDVRSGTFTTIDHDHPSWLELRLTATDSDGNSVTTSRRLDPLTTTLNISASSPGVQVAFNDRVLRTPFSRTVIVGSTNTLGVPERQSVSDYDWRFDAWQDQSGSARFLTAPSTALSLHLNGHLLGWRRLDGVPIAGNDFEASSGDYRRDRAFDGDLTTGYRSAQTGSRIGLDFGGPRTVGKIVFAPLAGAGTMVGGYFQGANRSNFSGAATLFSITAQPAANGYTTITESDGLVVGSFRYIRYVAPSGSVVSLAELQASTSQAITPLTAKGSGSPAKSGSSLSNVSDNKQATSYTANQASGASVILDLGEPRDIALIRYAPDLKSPATMRGGVFQVANASDFRDKITVLTVSATPAPGMHERAIASGRYRYVRYVGPVNSASRIAEFSVLATSVPQTPRGLETVNVITRDAVQGVQLGWSDSSTIETGYRVRRSADDGSWTTVANLPANSTSYIDTSLRADHKYSYRVIPQNEFGYGDSTVISTTVAKSSGKPATPSKPTLTIISGDVRVAWSDLSNNETSFRVERRFANYVWGTLATLGANANTFLDTTAASEVIYEYRVVAKNALGESTSVATTIET